MTLTRSAFNFLCSRSSTQGVILAAAVLFVGLQQSKAANSFTAQSASRADVGAAVALAKDGDTVNVPAGTATWTTGLTITNNITIQGAGPTSTIITNGISGGSSRPPLIQITLARNLPFRMTGFTFKGGAATAETFNGEVRICGNSHAFRIDHCTFDSLHGTNLGVSGFLWGVIDHCNFNLANEQPIHIGHETWNGSTFGNGSWADDVVWGSEKFVFIEDNVFENTGSKAIDAYEGARFVSRYNQSHNCNLSVHGTEGQGRGARAIEEYNNTYRNDKPDQAGQIRSGSIVTHDNTWTNVAHGHVLEAYRPYSYSPHWGYCTGQNPYDDNAPNGTTGYWETGKHTGANGASVLTDSTKNWTTNQWYQPGVIYIVRNITQEKAATTPSGYSQSFAIGNTAHTVTISPFWHVGAPGAAGPLTFNTGDVYQIWKVVHSIDQPGLGKGALLTGLPGLPATWPNQATEPCYSWNNTQNGEARDLLSTEPEIKEGRDFFNATPKPNYKPYTYPHPLTRPAAPTNLAIAN